MGGQGDLHGGQCSEDRQAPSAEALGSLPQRLHQIGAPRRGRRGQAEEECGESAGTETGQQDAMVEAHLASETLELEESEESPREQGDGDPCDSRDQGQEGALRKQVTHDARAAAAQGHPQAGLPLPLERPGQEQARDVGAGEEEEEPDGDAEHLEDRLKVATIERMCQPAGEHADASLEIRQLSRSIELVGEDLQLLPGL